MSSEDIGAYTCKLINEIGMTMTRAKFDISSTTQVTEGIDKKIKTKKKIIKKSAASTAASKASKHNTTTGGGEAIHKTTISIVPANVVETSMEIIKIRKPVSILVEQSGVSEVKEVKDRKIADAEEMKEKMSSSITTTTTTTTQKTTTESVMEVTESVKIIRTKISQKTISIEDMIILKQHREVTWLLNSIEAESFGTIGEAALRDLATIGLLLRYGCTIIEIIYMYEQNIFIALQKPESQSALVQLVEREGHEELITQILSESSTDDETTLAATVGFKAFIRMIQTYEITIETVIRKFVREDFITQDWKISGKEVCTLSYF